MRIKKGVEKATERISCGKETVKPDKDVVKGWDFLPPLPPGQGGIFSQLPENSQL